MHENQVDCCSGQTRDRQAADYSVDKPSILFRFIADRSVDFESKMTVIRYMESNGDINEIGQALLLTNSLESADLGAAYELIRSIGRIGDVSHLRYLEQYDREYSHGWMPGEFGTILYDTKRILQSKPVEINSHPVQDSDLEAGM